MRRLAAPVLVLLLLLAGPEPAHAHLMNSGFGPFYDGLAHPFVVPEDLLPALALALLAGLRGPTSGRRVLFALPIAWLLGMVLGGLVPALPALGWFRIGFTVLLGVLVAADAHLSVAGITALAVAAGVAHGIANGRDLQEAVGGRAAMAGIAVALFVLVSLVAGQVASLRVPWTRIVVRVGGSWVAAVGLLMLGLALR
jgi:urease accessory protein